MTIDACANTCAVASSRRDARPRASGRYGQNSSVKMCKVAKVGTKQWRRVFSEGVGLPSDRSWHLPAPAVGEPPRSELRFVFYRDPLERFLSAYLDKCEGWRIVEGHCEPLSIFGIGGWQEAKKLNPRADPMKLLLPPRKGTYYLAC